MNPLVLAFLAVFVVGPFAFFRITTAPPSARRLRWLSAGVAGGVGLSLLARLLASGDAALWIWVSIIAMWMAWICCLAFAALRIRQARPDPMTRKWTALVGAFGTTVPWFGLASARLMTA